MSSWDDTDRWVATGVFPGGAVKIAEVNNEGRYEGDGVAIAKTPDGMYHVAEYSHCSCDDGKTRYVGAWPSYQEARRNCGSYSSEDLPETEPE